MALVWFPYYGSISMPPNGQYLQVINSFDNDTGGIFEYSLPNANTIEGISGPPSKTAYPQDTMEFRLSWSSDSSSFFFVKQSNWETILYKYNTVTPGSVVGAYLADSVILYQKWGEFEPDDPIYDVVFHPEGEIVYLIGEGHEIYECNLSSPWDISDLDFSQAVVWFAFSLPGLYYNRPVNFDPFGENLFFYVFGQYTSSYFYRIPVSSGFDISTMAEDFADVIQIEVLDAEGSTTELARDDCFFAGTITPDGKYAIVAQKGNILKQYKLM